MVLDTDREEAAELYFPARRAGSRKAITYRRFSGVAEAVRFVMNDLSLPDRKSCFLELGEKRIGYDDIRKLHERLSNQRRDRGAN